MSVSHLLGKTLLFRYAATNNTPSSSETTLTIPTRGPAPVVIVYPVSGYGQMDGIIMGTGKGMEYRRVGASAWTKVSGSSIGYLAAGTYEIRYAATEISIASETRFVTVFVDGNDGSGSSSWNPPYPGNPNYPDSSEHTSSGGSSGSSSSYTVKFHTNGGSKVNSQTVKKNGQVKEPAVPVKENFLFLGWYADSKLTKPYDFDEKVTKNLTLYAKWAKVSGNDKGNDNDGSENPGYIEPTPVVPTPVDPTPVEPVTNPSNPPAQTQSSILHGDSGISYVNGRSEGVFAPNLSITRGEAAVILYRLMSDEARAAYYASSNNFDDVGSDTWYNEAISTLVQAGVLGGYGDGTFCPEQPVTRAELAAILVRANGGSTSGGGSGFTDTSGHWAEGYILSAVMSGLVYGYEDGSFKPNQSVTRAESVAMINRMLMRSAMDSSASAAVTFTDVQPSDWFYGDVMAAANGYLG